jgi:hypothetical protein
VLRARIVLLAAQGRQDLEIAATLGIVPRTAAPWRARLLKSGVAGWRTTRLVGAARRC